MSQKRYRRLTRFLFFFLFLIFFLLYLLLNGQGGQDTRPGTGGGWAERRLALGEMRVSEVRSGGFLVDEFPIPAATRIGDPEFNENVIVCATTVYNEGEEAVDVAVSIHGTKQKDDADPNPGLCCGFYSYGGETDPAGGDWAALLADPNPPWTVTPHAEKNLELHRRETAFRLAPGERRGLVLFFWADETVLPTITDLNRDAYSVTVKLTSRGAV